MPMFVIAHGVKQGVPSYNLYGSCMPRHGPTRMVRGNPSAYPSGARIEQNSKYSAALTTTSGTPSKILVTAKHDRPSHQQQGGVGPVK